MSIGDWVNKGKDALNSDQGEEMSDNVLNAAADGVNKLTGDKFADQVRQGRDAADNAIGKQDAPRADETRQPE